MQFNNQFNKIWTVLAVVGLLVSVVSQASREDRRQRRQGARINQGVKAGELTTHEARAMRREQRKINRMERRAQADGVITDQEKARLEHAQDKASKHISKAKHNDESRVTKEIGKNAEHEPVAGEEAPAAE